MTSPRDIVETIDGVELRDGDLEVPCASQELIRLVESGKLVVLKGAFPREDLHRIRAACAEFARAHEPSNPDVQPGTPNYYRIDIDPPKSQVKRISRSFASFYWNPTDFGGERTLMHALARLRNRLAGLPTDYALTQVEDGYISGPSVIHYPVGGGYLQTHKDPPSRQRVVVTAILSERGKDYDDGGLYVDDEAGDRVSVDSELATGDIYLLNPAMTHGVAAIDPSKSLDFDTTSGRWMMFSTLVWLESLHGKVRKGDVAEVV